MFVASATAVTNPIATPAQSAAATQAVRGLAPFEALLATPAGKAALASNYRVTGDIERGTSNQPALQPFAQQREQALKDAFITGGNALELADGLGTRLDAAYRSLATYTSDDNGKTATFTNVSPHLAQIFGYSYALAGADSAAAKLFFGKVDVFGKAYDRPAGSSGADPNGDSRPFQTESNFAVFSGTGYFGITATNEAYLQGPIAPLSDSPSFPSGHATYGWTESMLLATMVPQRWTQMVTRAAEYGNSRVVLGAHYAMDVTAARALALYDLAHLLSDDPAYIGQTHAHISIDHYRLALASAKSDLIAALEQRCGASLVVCARDDTGRFSNDAANAAFYESTQTYGLPVVYESTANRVEDVATVAPEAGELLVAAFPPLTLAQADRILTETEGPGGGFLDDGSSFGLYSRLDLYAAGKRALLLEGDGTDNRTH